MRLKAVGPALMLALAALCAPLVADAQERAHRKLALEFERNQGQTDASVEFLVRGRGYTLFLTSTGATMAFRDLGARPSRMDQPPSASRGSPGGAVLEMRLVGASRAPRVVGRDQVPGTRSAFIGSDPTRWRTAIPAFARAVYEGVYPGVDLVYYGCDGELEYDFVLAPGADPGQIVLAFEGADTVEIDGAGDLVLGLSGRVVRFRRPAVYQDIAGSRRSVRGAYLLLPGGVGGDAGGRTPAVGFRVTAYDPTRPLVIDPVLNYATSLGGSGTDAGNAIAVDAAGNAYLAGVTSSADFPGTAGAAQATVGGDFDAFVAKLDPSGSTLLYATYLGGRDSDAAFAVSVDSSGNAYVTGVSYSPDFPTTAGALQTTFGGQSDGFVVKLDATGSRLVYATYLGGPDFDRGTGIKVDAAGNAYVTGVASSPFEVPTPGSAKISASASQVAPVPAHSGGEISAALALPPATFPTTPGAFQSDSSGAGDVFVAKLDVTGSTLIYSTYLGGRAFDGATGIALDAGGNASVTGGTFSVDFPTTPGAFQTIFGGFVDAFVAKLNSAGSALMYSTYLGGANIDAAAGIAVDAAGSAYVTGGTISTDFPVASPIQPPPAAGLTKRTVFVSKLRPDGSSLVYSTLLGGTGGAVVLDPDIGIPEPDEGLALAVDSLGSAHIAGITGSTDLPTTVGALQTAFGGGSFDGYLTKLDTTGTVLLYSTYLGGSARDQGDAIAVSASGDVFVAGATFSADFPTTAGAFQAAFGGDVDAYVAKIRPEADLVPLQFVNFPAAFPSLPREGKVGVPYVGNIGIGGGRPPYTITVVEGSLPPGLGFSSPILSGTPTQAVAAEFILEIVDQAAARARKRFEIIVGVESMLLTRTARLSLSGTPLRPGQTLTVGLEVQSSLADPAADLYVGILLPDGQTARFFSGPGVLAEPVSLASPAGFPKMQAAVRPGYAYREPAFFQFTVPAAGVPPGTYTIVAALVRAGSLEDNQVGLSDLLVFDIKEVTFSP